MKRILLALLALTTSMTAHGAAVIFSGNDVKTLKSNIDLNGGPKILSGTVDPSVSATDAQPGSIYLNSSNGNDYRKTDSGSSTNWVLIGSGAGGTGNLLLNPSADTNTSNWSASGGSFARTTTASQWSSSPAGFSFDASAGAQTVDSNTHSITATGGVAGRNGVVSCAFKTDAVDYRLQVIDGSANILAGGSEVIPTSSSAFSRFSLNFIFPNATDTVKLRVVSQSDASVIYFDDCYLGLAEGFNISNVSQASFYGGVFWPPVASCAWGVTSGAFTDFPADSDCTFPAGSNLYGAATAPATKIPAAQFNNMPPGEYYFVASGFLQSQTPSSNCQWRFSDGTNFSTPSDIGGTAVHNNPNVVGRMSFDVAASRTISLQIGGDGGTCAIQNASAMYGLTILAYRYPTQSSLLSSVGDLPRLSDAKFAGATNCSWSTTSGSFANFASDADCNDPTLLGDATSAGKVPGVTRGVLPRGRYLVLANGGYEGVVGTTQTNCEYTISDGTTTASFGLTVSTTGAVATTVSQLAGVFDYSSVQTNKTFQIQARRVAGDGTCQIYNGSTGTSFEMTIVPLDIALPMPVIVNSVSTSSSGQERAERVMFRGASSSTDCTTDPCTIESSSGGATSVNRASTGVYTVNFATGTFSGKPTCTCGNFNYGIATNPFDCAQRPNSSTATAVVLHSSEPGVANRDGALSVLCQGPR